MFVRRKHNRSGTTSIQVIAKVERKALHTREEPEVTELLDIITKNC